MTILRKAPGFLSRAFGIPAVQYRTAPGGTWVDLPDAHYGGEVAGFVADEERALESDDYEVAMTVNESSPQLQQGYEVRLGGANGRVYAVRSPAVNKHHGVNSYVLSRSEVKRRTHDRGRTQ